jgi:galactokinase
VSAGASVLDPARLRLRLAEIEPGAAHQPDRVRIVRAPGRVNLIGEHTDYNDGFVMPAAIGLETWLCYVPMADGRVEMTLDASGERDGFSLEAIGPRRGRWIDYVAGTAWAVAAAGGETHGFRGLLAATLPRGAGLSSSAAIELASAWALAGSERPTLDDMALARACQRAENEYVGVRCGLMDQFASSHGRQGAALLLDCRSLEYRPVPLPLAEVALVVCHTGSARKLGTSAYNERRAQCEAAVRAIGEREPGVRSLRDIDVLMLERSRDRLDKVLYQRALHIITENARVLEVEEALAAGDMARVGYAFAESHASLRDRYEVSSAELDALVEIAADTEGVVAARMTGAGFGGCTVNLVRREAVERFRDQVAAEYRKRTRLRSRIWVVEPARGAGPVDEAAA